MNQSNLRERFYGLGSGLHIGKVASRAFFFCASLGIALTVLPLSARGDDWSVRRDPFDKRIVGRYKALLERRPNDGYALAKLVKLYSRYRTLGALIKEYQNKARRNPKRFSYQVIVGNLYRRSGQREKAIVYYQKAAALRPKSPAVPAALGSLYKRMGKYPEAVAEYKKALSLSRTKRSKKRYLRALANIALNQRDLTGARTYFKRLVKLDPRNVFLRIELAQSLARAKLHKEAIEQYRRILKRTSDTPTRANVLKQIGFLQEKLKQPQKAIATYQKAMRLAARGHFIRRELTDRIISIYRQKDDLKTLIALYEKKWKRRGHFEWQVLGRLYDETGDEERAAKAYHAALKKSGRAIDTRVRLIALLERSGRDKEVIKQYRKLAAIASGEPRYQLELAKRLYRQGKQKEAVKVLERAGRRFPRDASVHSALADLFQRWGEKKRALREARILVKIEPRDDSHVINLGEQYFMRGQKRKAVEIWRRLLRTIPQKHKAYAKLAAIYGDHDMTQKAIALYRKAIRLKPKMVPYQRALALLLEGKRRYTEALESWDKVLKLAKTQKAMQTAREARTHTIDILNRTYRLRHRMRAERRRFENTPPDIDAGFFLAQAYRKLRDLKSAERVYVKLLGHEPQNLEALTALETVYRKQRKLAKAVELLKKLAKLQPKRRRHYYERIATLQLLLFNDKEALAYAHKALALGRQNARAYRRLGELYEAKEDFAGALKAYKKALELAPSSHGIRLALARLQTRRGAYAEAEKLYRSIIVTASTPEMARRAFRKGVVLSSYLGKLDQLERALIPLAIRNTQLAESYRAILVSIYQRRVPMLVYQARQGSPKQRSIAKKALAKIGLRGMAPLLEQLSNPSTTHSRKRQLIRMLGYLGNPNAAIPLLRIAEKEPVEPPIIIYGSYYRSSYRSRSRRSQTDLRVAATVAVGRLADKRAIPGLIKLMSSREGALRDAAAWGLSHLRDRRVQRALFKALGDSRPTVQMMACAGLGMQGKTALRPVLEEVMLDAARTERVRASCAWALGVLGDRRAIRTLDQALASGYEEVARCAAWSLGAMRARAGMGALIRSLWSRKPRTRAAILWALRQISKKDPKTEEQRPPDIRMKWGSIDTKRFVDRLADESDHIGAKELSQALRQLGAANQTALEAGVITALGKHRDVILRVLRDLDGAKHGLTLGPLSKGRNKLSSTERKELEGALKKLAKAIAPTIERLLKNSDPAIRERAASVFVKLDLPRARVSKTLEQLFSRERNWQVRSRVLDLLAHPHSRIKLSRSDKQKLLVGITAKRHWREREAAARLAGTLGTRGAAMIARAMKDPNGFVRQAAALSATRLPANLAIPHLLTALRDPAAEVRLTAARACGVYAAERRIRAALERLLRDSHDATRKAAQAVLSNRQ
jgi:tetratricopeptide (TPR) repeat protein